MPRGWCLDVHDIDQVTVAFMPSAELPGALLEGEIDAFAGREPYVSQAEAALGGRAVTFEGFSHVRQYLALAVTEALAERDAETAQALLRALLRAERLAYTSPESARRAVVRHLGSARRAEVVRDWPEHHFQVAAGVGFLIKLESLSRWAIRTIPEFEAPIPNYLELLFLDPLREVRPESVSIQT